MNLKSSLSQTCAALPLRMMGLSAALAAGLASTAFAQDTSAAEEAPAEASTEQAADASTDFPLGTPVAEVQVGQTYSLETHGDWEIQCVKAPEGSADPCNIFQLLTDEVGTEVAQVAIFHYGQGQVDAAATFVAPLATHLPAQLTLAIDGSNGVVYPYTFCTSIGCFARFGLTAADVEGLKKGVKGVATIVPAERPDQKVNLDISLSGFTAAYTRVTEITLAARAAATAAQ